MQWTKKDVQELRRLFPSRATVEVAVLMGRTVECVKKQAQRRGFRKTKKYLKSLGR